MEKENTQDICKIEDLQKELFSQSQQMNSIKAKEIKDIEYSLQSQFQEEMRKYQEKISQLNTDLNNSKVQNKEVANEMVSLTNENSQLTLRLRKLDAELKVK